VSISAIMFNPRQHTGLSQISVILDSFVPKWIKSTNLKERFRYVLVPIRMAIRVPERRLGHWLINGFNTTGLETIFQHRVIDVLQSGCVEIPNLRWHIGVWQQGRDTQVLASNRGVEFVVSREQCENCGQIAAC
jgi:hypothetical protein